MLYRCFRAVDTGQWIDVLFTVHNKNGDGLEEFSAELSHRTDIAAAFGWGPEALETVDALLDSRAGALLAMPLPVQPESTRTEELLAVGKTNWNNDQRDELLELLARDV